MAAAGENDDHAAPLGVCDCACVCGARGVRGVRGVRSVPGVCVTNTPPFSVSTSPPGEAPTVEENVNAVTVAAGVAAIMHREAQDPSLTSAPSTLASNLGAVADVVDRIQRQRAEEGRPDYGVKVELQCCDQSCVLTLMGTNPLLFRRLREQREFHQQRLGSATSDAGAIPLRNPNTGKDTMFGHTAAGKVDPSR